MRHIATNGIIYNGGFVKGPTSWLARIPSIAGQPYPKPGDEAFLTIKSQPYRKPVPVTLVDIVKEGNGYSIWSFTDGHEHSEMPNPIQNSPSLQAEAADHPHRRQLDTWRERRPGQLRQNPQHCETPLVKTEEPQEPVDPDNPEGYDFEDPRHPWWQ